AKDQEHGSRTREGVTVSFCGAFQNGLLLRETSARFAFPRVANVVPPNRGCVRNRDVACWCCDGAIPQHVREERYLRAQVPLESLGFRQQLLSQRRIR